MFTHACLLSRSGSLYPPCVMAADVPLLLQTSTATTCSSGSHKQMGVQGGWCAASQFVHSQAFRTLNPSAHRWKASADCLALLPAGASSELLNLNPSGWSRGCAWHMFYGADANRELRLVLAGAVAGAGYYSIMVADAHLCAAVDGCRHQQGAAPCAGRFGLRSAVCVQGETDQHRVLL